jgi:vacuolar-type H+-ATPase subunit I/STV1
MSPLILLGLAAIILSILFIAIRVFILRKDKATRYICAGVIITVIILTLTSTALVLGLIPSVVLAPVANIDAVPAKVRDIPKPVLNHTVNRPSLEGSIEDHEKVLQRYREKLNEHN